MRLGVTPGLPVMFLYFLLHTDNMREASCAAFCLSEALSCHCLHSALSDTSEDKVHTTFLSAMLQGTVSSMVPSLWAFPHDR